MQRLGPAAVGCGLLYASLTIREPHPLSHCLLLLPAAVVAQCGVYWSCTGSGNNLNVGPLVTTTSLTVQMNVTGKVAGSCANNNVLLSQVRALVCRPFAGSSFSQISTSTVAPSVILDSWSCLRSVIDVKMHLHSKSTASPCHLSPPPPFTHHSRSC